MKWAIGHIGFSLIQSSGIDRLRTAERKVENSSMNGPELTTKMITIKSLNRGCSFGRLEEDDED